MELDRPAKPLTNRSEEIKTGIIHSLVSVGYALASWLFFSTMATVTMAPIGVTKQLPVLSDFDIDTFAFLVAAVLGIGAIIHGALGLKKLT